MVSKFIKKFFLFQFFYVTIPKKTKGVIRVNKVTKTVSFIAGNVLIGFILKQAYNVSIDKTSILLGYAVLALVDILLIIEDVKYKNKKKNIRGKNKRDVK
jgi:uncharacterized membrane protein